MPFSRAFYILYYVFSTDFLLITNLIKCAYLTVCAEECAVGRTGTRVVICRAGEAATRQYRFSFPSFHKHFISCRPRSMAAKRCSAVNTKTLSGSMRSEPRRLIRSACMRSSSVGSFHPALHFYSGNEPLKWQFEAVPFMLCCVSTNFLSDGLLSQPLALTVCICKKKLKEQRVATGTGGHFFVFAQYFRPKLFLVQ